MTEDKKPFNMKSINEKQAKQRQEYEEKMAGLRTAFDQVAKTPSGKEVLSYIYKLCGGDSGSLRTDKDGLLAINETIVFLGARSVWESIRLQLPMDKVLDIEEHFWEKNNK